MEERKAYSKRITTLLLYIFHQYLRHNHQTKRYLNIKRPTSIYIFILTIKTGSLKITSFWKKVINLQPQLFQNHDQVRYIRFKI